MKAGETKSDFVFIVTDKDLSEGTYQGILNLKQESTVVAKKPFIVSISKEAPPTGGVIFQPTTTTGSFYRNWIDSGRIFWILGIIVILILIIFFLKLILTRSA